MKYYIQAGGVIHGPLGEEEVRRRIRERAYGTDDLVRQEDQEQWTPLQSSDAFKSVLHHASILRSQSMTWAMTSLLSGAVPIFLMMLLWILEPIGVASNRVGSNADVVALIVICLGSSFVAIVAGHVALGKIHRSQQKLSGYGTARGGLWLGYFFGVVLPALSVFADTGHPHIQEKANISKAMNNCRQVIIGLRLYSADHNGQYPDAALPGAKTSNEVFRQLFMADAATDEMIFGSPGKRTGQPDGNIGQAPDFKAALQANENHWAMTRGLNDAGHENVPLVFEDPAEATWPPKWDPSLIGTIEPGCTWKNGKVIIGYNDGTVKLETLETLKGTRAKLKPREDGQPVFPQLSFPVSVLNVEKALPK